MFVCTRMCGRDWEGTIVPEGWTFLVWFGIALGETPEQIAGRLSCA